MSRDMKTSISRGQAFGSATPDSGATWRSASTA
jgi:hypothetical protein